MSLPSPFAFFSRSFSQFTLSPLSWSLEQATFGIVLTGGPKQTIIQSEQDFGVTWYEVCFHEVFYDSWWSSQIWVKQSSNIYSQYVRLLLPCQVLAWSLNLFTFISGLDKLRAKREPWIRYSRYSLARNELRIALEFRFSGRAIVQKLGHICRQMKWLNTGQTE